MAARIAFFNQKGGVGKTTTVFNLGWTLAAKGKRVIIADCDYQCALTEMVTGLQGTTEFEAIYRATGAHDFRTGLAPAFESGLAPIEAVECIVVPNAPNLFLLPGHIGLAEFEVTLTIAQDLSGAVSTLQNIPGAISHLLDVTATKYKADYVLLDMSPALGSLNQNLLMTSDYFIVPMVPSSIGLMAIDSLTATLPKWYAWAATAQKNGVLRESVYPFRMRLPCFLGSVMQRVRMSAGGAERSEREIATQLQERIRDRLALVIGRLGMTLPKERYLAAKASLDEPLMEVPEIRAAIDLAHDRHLSIFALNDDPNLQDDEYIARLKNPLELAIRAYSGGADKIIGLTK